MRSAACDHVSPAASPLADRREDQAGRGDDAARDVGVLRGPASGRRSELAIQLEGGLQAVQADEDVVGTSWVRELERRVRELERVLGRKTWKSRFSRKLSTSRG